MNKIKMGRIIKKHSYLMLLFFICISCGYSKTEDDKYPDMPVFPKHSSSNISISSLGMKIYSLYDYGNNDMITYIERTDEDDFIKSYVVTIDKDLNVKDSLSAGGSFAVLNNNQFIIESEEGKLFRYSDFKSKPKHIKLHPFEGRLYQEEIKKDLLKDKYSLDKYPDSLSYKIIDKVDSISYYKAASEFKRQVVKGLECVVNVGSYSKVLIYKDDMYLLNSLPYYPNHQNYEIKAPNRYIDEMEGCTKTPLQLGEPGDDYLSIEDTAVTGNGSSGGNHFVPGTFYPKGIQYYSLDINGEKTTFKKYSERLNSRKINSRYIPETDFYIIDIVNDGSRYAGEYSYIARIKK